MDPLFSDGVIVIDKPAGPTSHDVVAVMRRVLRNALRERSDAYHPPTTTRQPTLKVGHTGTLDPLASGVLPLVLGKATRLAQFLASAEKEYEADIELGATTTTLDRGGDVVPRADARPISEVTAGMIDEAVASFRGTYLQQPPAYSAKKVEGDRAYDLARRNAPVRLEPVTVTASALDVIAWTGSSLRVRLVCSAGYYVRSLAGAIGDRLGTGAHLSGLVRTRSGDFSLKDAVNLDVLDRHPAAAAARVLPLTDLLPSLPALTLTAQGAALAARGGFLTPAHLHPASVAAAPDSGRVRLFHPDDGRLVALAKVRIPESAGRRREFLHPDIVLD